MQQKWNQNFDGEPMTDIPQKFLNAGCDVYMVMQLRHDEKILDERFASMRELHRRCKTPNPEHYEVTYYADIFGIKLRITAKTAAIRMTRGS